MNDAPKMTDRVAQWRMAGIFAAVGTVAGTLACLALNGGFVMQGMVLLLMAVPFVGAAFAWVLCDD